MSGLVVAAIAPHGHLAIPEALPLEQRNLAPATQQGMAEIGRRFQAARPDVTVIVTPHNVHVEGHFAIVEAGKMAGSLGQWTSQQVELEDAVDRDLALAVIGGLRGAGIPALGVSYGGNAAASATAPMDWATLVPLWFTGGRFDPPVPVVAVCPARDRSPEEHVHAGQVIAEVAAASGKRVAMVASSDHGHAHQPSGPYGFDPAAAEYDNRVVDLIRAGRLRGVTDIDPSLVAAAKADSYWQMLMLYGAIGDAWKGEFLSYEVPTYFGMITAVYEPA